VQWLAPQLQQKRLCNGQTPSLQGKKGTSPSNDCRGNLVERAVNGGRMGHLKLVNIRALVDNNRVTLSQSKSQNGPKIAAGNIGGGIVVELIHVVDFAGEGGELNNPWSGCGETQRMGGIRIHDACKDVFMTAIQMMNARTVME
jgi:hypothetical protein